MAGVCPRVNPNGDCQRETSGSSVDLNECRMFGSEVRTSNGRIWVLPVSEAELHAPSLFYAAVVRLPAPIARPAARAT